jgi:hypothetical protein
MESIYEMARQHGKHLNLVTASQEELHSGAILERFPTGITLTAEVDSVESAAELMSCYAKQPV